jgi:ketosteroid isomerase-like protein/heme-degrading monooxygenase HmoA
MPSVTPADVLDRRRRLILNGDADGFADLFAPDAVIEAPFAPAGAPARLVGREAIREYARHVVASPLRLEDFEVAELYQTPDPEVVIAEMRAKATVITTGRSVAATSIQILRIRDGQIVLFRDFADPRVLADVIGEPRPEFARVITAQAGATGFDDVIRFAQEQLPSARQQPGFKGFYLLTDAGTGKVITISLWDSREQMAAVEALGARMTAQAAPATGLTPLQRETYEVSVQA